MSKANNKSSAEVAAQEATEAVLDHINRNLSFIMEAGAGAGKTFSLKQALLHAIKTNISRFERNHQQIACITFTEAATEELKKDIDNNPIVWVSTIHAFCWNLLKDFQPELRLAIQGLPSWQEKIAEIGEIGKRKIVYDQGFRKITDDEIRLGHDDVPELIARFVSNPKFREIFVARYPILFIDEYQDTHKSLMESMLAYFLNEGKLLIGLFGDHWQRIYDGVCGEIHHPGLPVIKKHANFRSTSTIVDCLNRIRPELKQFANTNETGTVGVYQTQSWRGERGNGPHRGGSLPDEVAQSYLDGLLSSLESEGWDLSSETTKILFLTNTLLAKEQGYSDLLDCFPYPYTDQCLRKEDYYIKYFAETLEPVCKAYMDKNFGQMFSVLGSKIAIRSQNDKHMWVEDMDKIIEFRNTGTVGDVLDCLKLTGRLHLPDKILKKESQLQDYIQGSQDGLTQGQISRLEMIKKMRVVPYTQVVSLVNYIEGKTPFSTKHKVKGLEFENVLVVFSQGWSKYNFNKMLEWENIGNVPNRSQDRNFFENNRNLFYVVCSRPKKRLALLFTHELSDAALTTLSKWFGSDSVHPL